MRVNPPNTVVVAVVNNLNIDSTTTNDSGKVINHHGMSSNCGPGPVAPAPASSTDVDNRIRTNNFPYNNNNSQNPQLNFNNTNKPFNNNSNSLLLFQQMQLQSTTQNNGIIPLVAHPSSSYPHSPHPRQSSFTSSTSPSGMDQYNNSSACSTSTTTNLPMAIPTTNTNNNNIIMGTPGLISSLNANLPVDINNSTSRTTNPNPRPSNIHEILSSDPNGVTAALESNNNNTNGNACYNGIYLVDGLGSGVRIDNTNPNRMIPTHQLPVQSDPTAYQYGLPPVPLVQSTNRAHENNMSSTLQPIISTSIKIFDTNNTTGNVTCSTTTNSQTQQPYPAAPARSIVPSAVIPILGGGSSGSNNNSVIVPKVCKRNSVTLPVPSPPSHSVGNTPLSPGLITITPTPAVSTTSPGILTNVSSSSSSLLSPVTILSSPTSINHNVTLSSGKSPGESQSTSHRTPTVLISTEAQTEDLPTLLAPPPPPPARNNREQRKRERRERRRDRNSVYGHSNSTSGHHRNHGPSTSSNSRRESNTNNSGGSAGESNPNSNNSSDQPNSNSSESQTHPPQQESSSSSGLPDLLNVNLPPPPYSTLPPQNCDRRVLGLGQIIQHPQGPMAQPPPPSGQHPTMLVPPNCPTLLGLPPPVGCQPPNCLPNQPIRYHFSPPAPPPLTRASRRSLRTPRGVPYASEEEPKSCCGMSTSQAVSIRWFIIVIAVIGICCTVAGTALGAARSAGSQHLTLSLLMIGVGVVLLTVSAVAWRLTANESGSSSCRAMLGITRNGNTRGDGGSEPNRVFVPRLPPSYGRPHHPYAAMMYPDFQYRPPPPSYQASMQEYRLRLLLLERSNPTIAAAAAGVQSALNMGPPPPAYRPYNATLRPGIHGRTEVVDYSRPPSYRSRGPGSTSTSGQESCTTVSRDPSGIVHSHHRIVESPLHSRDPSLLSYLSQQSIGDNVSVVSGTVHHHHPHNSSAVVTVMDLGLSYVTHHDDLVGSEHEVHGPGVEAQDDKEFPSSVVEVDEDRDELKIGHSSVHCTEKSKDGNLVRIVQTTDSSQVIGRDSVIVTVSGSPNNWEHHQHHHQNSHLQQSSPTTTHPNNQQHQTQYHRFSTTGPPDPNSSSNNNNTTNEVQILAHL